METTTPCCEHCGAKMVSYEHALSRVLVRALTKLAAAGPGPHRLRDIDLDYSERSNITKLKYWDFIVPVVYKKDWEVTALGHEFLRGEFRAPATVTTYRDQVTAFSSTLMGIGEVELPVQTVFSEGDAFIEA